MQIQPIFITPIAVEYLKLDNDAIVKYCKDKIYNSDFYTKKNHPSSDKLDLLENDVIKQLTSSIEKVLNDLYVELGLSDSYRLKISDAWANLNLNFSLKESHQHIDSIFTAVYYASVPKNGGGGRLVLNSPYHALQQRTIGPKYIKNLNSFTSDTFYITPEVGKLVIFPSWIYHYVDPLIGECERISIAFNSNYEPV